MIDLDKTLMPWIGRSMKAIDYFMMDRFSEHGIGLTKVQWLLLKRLKEMGYQIARKHADKLRQISLLCGFIFPFILTLMTFANSALLSVSCAILAVISCMIGVIVERWLFFAEAKHTVMLYYGSSTA